MFQLNILIDSSYNAVITDFGSARTKQSDNATKEDSVSKDAKDDIFQELQPPRISLNPSTLELTLTGPAFSLRWTAPEVLNNGTQDLPSDMWAIGWICWEVSTL